MQGCWIDLELVAMGYLMAADGRYRHIPGLDGIARDLRSLGVRARWGTPVNSACACSYPCSRVIAFAPALFEQSGDLIREVWQHELGHFAVGRSEARVQRWQSATYGPSLEGMACVD